ncbi:MAG: ChaN family lipoprotein [Chromatiales bacterium]|nr:MAG: ChaN family lipoprotein [Chromatiales bacterium]
MNTRRLLITFFASASMVAAAVAADDVLYLDVGDPERRDRQAPVMLDAITDTRTGEFISTDELVERLAGTNILFIGEEHTSIDFHRVQAHLIRALHESGRQVLIALEMFPYTQQKELDRWTRGQYEEAEFLKSADWYRYWGYHWDYYADIFRYARDNRIRMFGVNAPRKVIKAVRTEGFEDLSEEDLEHIPTTVDTDSPEHRRVYLAYFEDGDELHTELPPEQLDGMVRAQATWDAVMGWNSLQALRRHGGPNAIVVVLIGAGHAVYGVGSQRQIEPRFDGGIAALVPVSVTDTDGDPVTSVQASYADFIWGVPGSTDPVYPMLGVSLAGALGRAPNYIIQVDEDSPAAAAGLEVGDQLVAVNGAPVSDPASLRWSMGDRRWGDSVEVELRRDEETIRADVLLRRDSNEEPSGED